MTGELLILLIIAAIGYFLYQSGFKSGKHLGSRKAYGVGYARGRKSNGQNGCLIIFVLIGLSVAFLVSTVSGV
jgi:hypothetical protein